MPNHESTITREVLVALGAQVNHWKTAYKFSIEDGFTAIEVRFDDYPNYGREWMVFITAPQVAIALKAVTTLDDLVALKNMLRVQQA